MEPFTHDASKIGQAVCVPRDQQERERERLQSSCQPPCSTSWRAQVVCTPILKRCLSSQTKVRREARDKKKVMSDPGEEAGNEIGPARSRQT